MVLCFSKKHPYIIPKSVIDVCVCGLQNRAGSRYTTTLGERYEDAYLHLVQGWQDEDEDEEKENDATSDE